MADADSNLQLAVDTAEALLTEIKLAAPGAAGRGNDAVRSLAHAYALVRGAMPQFEQVLDEDDYPENLRH